MSVKNVEVVTRLMKAYQRGGYDGLEAAAEELLAPDFEMFLPAEHPDAGRPYKGMRAAADQMRAWNEAFADFNIEFEPPIDAGDQVVAVMHESGRVAGGGPPIDQEFAIVVSFDGERIRRMTWFVGRAPALEAAGLSPG